MRLPLYTHYKVRFYRAIKPSLNVIVGLLTSLAGASSCAQSLAIQLNDADGEPVSEAVIEILLPKELRSAYQPSADIEVDQMDKEFIPNVSTIVAGNNVAFPNSDDILHHVYSFSPTGTFYIPLYGKDTQDNYSQVFNEAGVIEIGCNLHDWMLAYIYVAETSLSSISDGNGQAALESVPTGTFELRIWHPRLKQQDVAMTHMIEFVKGEQVILDFTLELQRDRRIRRAPSSNRTRYR
jgi:plastocyanin